MIESHPLGQHPDGRRCYAMNARRCNRCATTGKLHHVDNAGMYPAFDKYRSAPDQFIVMCPSCIALTIIEGGA